MNRSKVIDWAVVIMLIIVLILSLKKAMGQDLPGVPYGSVQVAEGPISICQDPQIPGRFFVDDIPTSWRYPEEGQPGMFWVGIAEDDIGPAGYWKKSMYIRSYVDQSLLTWFDKITPGVVVLGLSDYSQEILGGPGTVTCDLGKKTDLISGTDFTEKPGEMPTLSPTIDPTLFSPPELQPTVTPGVIPAVSTPCAYLSIDFYTNEVSCQ